MIFHITHKVARFKRITKTIELSHTKTFCGQKLVHIAVDRIFRTDNTILIFGSKRPKDKHYRWHTAAPDDPAPGVPGWVTHENQRLLDREEHSLCINCSNHPQKAIFDLNNEDL